jgi:hypothetical protein
MLVMVEERTFRHKLTYNAMINPKIPMYLANFPCSKTPENNAITAVRKTIIKTLIS